MLQLCMISCSPRRRITVWDKIPSIPQWVICSETYRPLPRPRNEPCAHDDDSRHQSRKHNAPHPWCPLPVQRTRCPLRQSRWSMLWQWHCHYHHSHYHHYPELLLLLLFQVSVATADSWRDVSHCRCYHHQGYGRNLHCGCCYCYHCSIPNRHRHREISEWKNWWNSAKHHRANTRDQPHGKKSGVTSRDDPVVVVATADAAADVKGDMVHNNNHHWSSHPPWPSSLCRPRRSVWSRSPWQLYSFGPRCVVVVLRQMERETTRPSHTSTLPKEPLPAPVPQSAMVQSMTHYFQYHSPLVSLHHSPLQCCCHHRVVQ